MKEKNLYILIPNTELHKRYLRMFRETLPNIGNSYVCIPPTEYQKSWYGNYIQIEFKESCYLQRANVFSKMGAIVTESAEAFLKNFPHPKIESENGYI